MTADYSGLSEGEHTFQVRARDASGNEDESPASYIWEVDVSDAHWSFDEGAGTTAADSSVNSNDGTLIGTPDWVAGHIGTGALEFDGLNDIVVVPNSTVFESTSFTLTAWLYGNNSMQRRDYYRKPGMVILRNDASSVNPGPPKVLKGEWEILLYPSGEEIGSGYYFEDHELEWHHHAVVIDNAAQTVTFYVDGQQYGVSHPYDVPLEASTDEVHIGKYDTEVSQFGWIGMIDDMRFYDEMLSQSEIEDIYQTGQ
jgi:hypothetical protein